MFLPIMSNPHFEDKVTRVKVQELSPGQHYAVDAEQFMQRPALLDQFISHASLSLWGLTVLGYVMLVAGVAGAFLVAWWTWAVGVVLCAAMRLATRNLAAGMALRAARDSSEAFFYFHSAGVLWLVSSEHRRRRDELELQADGSLAKAA